MVKHGLALDLSKLTYSLDLSSPHLAPTINANLKALEMLSKVASYSISSRNQFNQDANRPKEKEGATEQTAATEGEEGRNTSPETLDENPNQFEPVSQSQSEVDTFPEYEEKIHLFESYEEKISDKFLIIGAGNIGLDLAKFLENNKE